MARTTDALITAVRARVAAPASDGLLSDPELLARIDEEMRADLVYEIVRQRSEYWLTEYTVAITSGTQSYRFPDRALGMALRDVTMYLTADSDEEHNLEQLSASERPYLTGDGLPSHFSLENGKVILHPSPNVTGYTLRLWYYRAPPELTLLANAAGIDAAASTTTLTLDVSPAPPTTLTTTGALIDIVRGAGMYEVLYERATSAWSSPTLTLDSAITTADVATATTQNERVDYVCVRGQTVYPPFPDTYWPALVALGCRVYCEAIKDTNGMRAANDIYQQKIVAARGATMPRVDGEPLRVKPRFTPLRSGATSRVNKAVT